MTKSNKFKSIEICAGAGGQAIGLEQAGFEHVLLVELEKEYCESVTVQIGTYNAWTYTSLTEGHSETK